MGSKQPLFPWCCFYASKHLILSASFLKCDFSNYLCAPHTTKFCPFVKYGCKLFYYSRKPDNSFASRSKQNSIQWNKGCCGAWELVQQLRASAVLAEDLTLVLNNHIKRVTITCMAALRDISPSSGLQLHSYGTDSHTDSTRVYT